MSDRLRRLHQVTSVYVGGTGRGARQQDENVTGEGSTNVKKIRILRDDDDNGLCVKLAAMFSILLHHLPGTRN